MQAVCTDGYAPVTEHGSDAEVVTLKYRPTECAVARRLPGRPSQIAVDASNNVFVAGRSVSPGAVMYERWRAAVDRPLWRCADGLAVVGQHVYQSGYLSWLPPVLSRVTMPPPIRAGTSSLSEVNLRGLLIFRTTGSQVDRIYARLHCNSLRTHLLYHPKSCCRIARSEPPPTDQFNNPGGNSRSSPRKQLSSRNALLDLSGAKDWLRRPTIASVTYRR